MKVTLDHDIVVTYDEGPFSGIVFRNDLGRYYFKIYHSYFDKKKLDWIKQSIVLTEEEWSNFCLIVRRLGLSNYKSMKR